MTIYTLIETEVDFTILANDLLNNKFYCTNSDVAEGDFFGENKATTAEELKEIASNLDVTGTGWNEISEKDYFIALNGNDFIAETITNVEIDFVNVGETYWDCHDAEIIWIIERLSDKKRFAVDERNCNGDGTFSDCWELDKEGFSVENGETVNIKEISLQTDETDSETIGYISLNG